MPRLVFAGLIFALRAFLIAIAVPTAVTVAVAITARSALAALGPAPAAVGAVMILGVPPALTIGAIDSRWRGFVFCRALGTPEEAHES